MNAVIYARFSSSGQREESIEGQLRECREFAKKHDMTIVGEYADKALTGRTDKRPDFQRMLRDSEKGIFQAVICWKMDRFARNRYDSAMYKYRLKKNGVRIFYAMESIPDGPEGILLESIMEGYAEYYSENLSQNVKRGNYDSALELKTIGQTVLGLRKGADGRFEIDPNTAPIIRRIFEEYAAGERVSDICQRLNSEGYRTLRGKPFGKGSLHRILQNDKYIGVYRFKDICVENGIPAIISKELFDRCGEILKRNKRAPAAKRDVNFLLTTKLFCGLCGEPMVGDSGTSRSGKVYYYYTCVGKKKKKCKKSRVNKEKIEDFVTEILIDLIHRDEFIREVADKCVGYLEREKDHSALHALENRLKETETAIKNLMTAIEAGLFTKTTQSRMVELETEREQLERGIAKQLIEEPYLDRDEIIYFLRKLQGGDATNEKYRTSLVEMFLNAVYLYDNDDGHKMVIALNCTGPHGSITLDVAEAALSEENMCSTFDSTSVPNDTNP